MITEEEIILIRQGIHPKYFWHNKPITWKKNHDKNESE